MLLHVQCVRSLELCFVSLLSVLPFCVAGDARGANRRGKVAIFLPSGIQPELVACILAEVGHERKARAGAFAECIATSTGECGSRPLVLSMSCSTVWPAVVQASGGYKVGVKENMTTVCGEIGLWSLFGLLLRLPCSYCCCSAVFSPCLGRCCCSSCCCRCCVVAVVVVLFFCYVFRRCRY